MPRFVESGIEVSFQHDTWFRLSEMEPYRRLSGKRLKEMDFGYWDGGSETLWLIELKGIEVWFDPKDDDCSPEPIDQMPVPRARQERLVDDLVGKATDSLMILSAVWSGTSSGKSFASLFPDSVSVFPGAGRIRMLFVLDVPDRRKSLLSLVRDQVNKFLMGRLNLFDFKSASVVDVETAGRLVAERAKGLHIRSQVKPQEPH